MKNSAAVFAPFFRAFSRGFIALALAFTTFLAAPAHADQAQINALTVVYTNTTLPAIAAMKPYISTSAAIRKTALAKTGFVNGHCRKPGYDADYDIQNLVRSDSFTCEALIGWLQDDDLETCYYVRSAFSDLTTIDHPRDPAIVKLHDTESVEKVLKQLQSVAGCAKKNSDYWGARTLMIFDQISAVVSPTGDLIAATKGVNIPTKDEFNRKISSCRDARTLSLDNKRDDYYTGAVESADSGCFALQSLVEKDPPAACKAFDSAIADINIHPNKGAIEREVPILTAKLKARLDGANCGQVLADNAKFEAIIAKMKEPAPAAPQSVPSGPTKQQQINVLIGEINGEAQNYNTNETYANTWESRGETFKACEYYQKMLYNLDELISKYDKLGELEGSYAYGEKIALHKQYRDNLYHNENDMCLDVKYHLGY